MPSDPWPLGASDAVLLTERRPGCRRWLLPDHIPPAPPVGSQASCPARTLESSWRSSGVQLSAHGAQGHTAGSGARAQPPTPRNAWTP